MPKETRDDREGKSGGSGGDGEDGLEQAAEQAAQLTDKSLAALFIEANKEAREADLPPIRELFVEEKKKIDFLEHDPDPQLLKEIYDSLANKDIHHKKLLEEGIPTNAILRFLYYSKKFLRISKSTRLHTIVTPYPWKFSSVCNRFWRKGINAKISDFSSLIDLWLRNKSDTQWILKWESVAMILMLLLCLPSIILFYRTPYAVNQDSQFLLKIWSNFIFSSSVISLVLTIIPLFCFMSLWFVNVNHLHTSKNFHFFLFSFFTAAFFLLALSLFNLGLFYLVDWRFGLSNIYQPLPPESPNTLSPQDV